MKVMKKVFSSDTSGTLASNQIHNFYIFKIEKEPYSEYDPELVHIRLFNWEKDVDPKGDHP